MRERKRFLYLDKFFVVLDKPVGLLTTPTTKVRDRTALEQTRHALNARRLFPVHRLDRETSGILLIARTKEAQDFLVERWNEVEKKYIAITHGVPKTESGSFSEALVELKDRSVRVANARDDKKRPSETRYRVLRSTKKRTTWELELVTGRKHQIRVHLSHAGFPVVGDARYGKKEGGRMLLHALSLRFPHPDGENKYVETVLPTEFK